MDHTSRLIGLAFVVAWTIFRLVRFLRAGVSRRTDTAAAPAVTASPIEPAGAAGAGFARSLLAAAVFIAGSAVIWSLLFLVPAIANVPPVLRMIAGLLATLYLIALARGVAARSGGRGQAADDNDPIK